MVGRGNRSSGEWCVLRTSGPKTLPLTASLREAGFDVWTPVQTRARRRPRSKEEVEYQAPILPTFVFARRDRLIDLMQIVALPTNPHPTFSLFRHFDRIPLISDGEIAALRGYERHCNDLVERGRIKAYRRKFAIGERVTVQASAWQGLSGIVEAGDGKEARVSFGGSLSVTIATFYLLPNDVEDSELYTGNAA